MAAPQVDGIQQELPHMQDPGMGGMMIAMI